MPQIDGKQVQSWSVKGKQLGVTTRDAVRAATTGALPACTYAGTPAFTLTCDASTILPAQDGITLVATEQLLVKDQAVLTQNGVYVVTSVGVAGVSPWILTRRSDFQNSAAIFQGTSVKVVLGTVAAKTEYVQVTANPIVLDTSDLVWEQMLSSVATQSVPTASNKNMTAEVAAADYAKACDTAIAATPVSDGYVDVRCNGVEMLVSSGDRTGEVYFSDDAGATGRTIAAIASGDKIYLGTGRLYDLAATDKISFHYNVLQ